MEKSVSSSRHACDPDIRLSIWGLQSSYNKCVKNALKKKKDVHNEGTMGFPSRKIKTKKETHRNFRTKKYTSEIKKFTRWN